MISQKQREGTSSNSNVHSDMRKKSLHFGGQRFRLLWPSISSVQPSHSTRYLLQIWYNHSLGLSDLLITFQQSNVKGQGYCEHTFVPSLHILALTMIHKTLLAFKWVLPVCVFMWHAQRKVHRWEEQMCKINLGKAEQSHCTKIRCRTTSFLEAASPHRDFDFINMSKQNALHFFNAKLNAFIMLFIGIYNFKTVVISAPYCVLVCH